jgi:hypothetical protein
MLRSGRNVSVRQRTYEFFTNPQLDGVNKRFLINWTYYKRGNQNEKRRGEAEMAGPDSGEFRIEEQSGRINGRVLCLCSKQRKITGMSEQRSAESAF